MCVAIVNSPSFMYTCVNMCELKFLKRSEKGVENEES